jgi:hypothetical protein
MLDLAWTYLMIRALGDITTLGVQNFSSILTEKAALKLSEEFGYHARHDCG